MQISNQDNAKYAIGEDFYRLIRERNGLLVLAVVFAHR